MNYRVHERTDEPETRSVKRQKLSKRTCLDTDKFSFNGRINDHASFKCEKILNPRNLSAARL
jgi:hypothetical protein